MDEKYTVVLADGTTIDNLTLNGNNFIYTGVLDDSIFTDANLTPTIIKHGDDEEYHPHMRYIKPYWEDPEGIVTTWFVLYDRDPKEIREEAINEALAVMAQATLDDSAAESAAILFPEWSGDSVSYSVGDRVRYNERLAKCIQAHTSQPTWTPQDAPSLWSWLTEQGDTTDPDSVEWPKWIQPVGSHDAYSKGAKVSHKEKHWVSDIDSNVWEPGVSGWTEHTE